MQVKDYSQKMIDFHAENSAQAMVEYILIVTILIFGTLFVVDGVDLPFEIDGDIVRLKGFKDAINVYLYQIYNLLHIMIP